MTISTKSLQHVNAPLGIKMLILKEKKSSCGLTPLVLYSLWGELSFLLLGLDGTSNVHWCRVLDQVRISGCLFSFKGYNLCCNHGISSGCSGLASGHSALTQREQNDFGSTGNVPGLQPKGLLSAWGSLCGSCRVPSLHLQGQLSQEAAGISIPGLCAQGRAHNHPVPSGCRITEFFMCWGYHFPLWGSLCASPEHPRGAKEMLELLLSICMSPKL